MISSPVPPPASQGWLRWGVRGYRLLLLLSAVLLLQWSQQRLQQQALGPAVSLQNAQRLFPQADRLGPRDVRHDGHLVYTRGGDVLGYVLRTSPQTDDLIGYAGPNDLLIGLTPDGELTRTIWLESGDTAAHVTAVRADPDFWPQLQGWQPGSEPFPRIAAVSGSTLTSLAIAEALQRRLAGTTGSLRFPEEVTLAEVQGFFPTAVAFRPDGSRPGWYAVSDAQQQPLGHVVRTSPVTDNLIGYRGPSECLFSVGLDGQTIQQVQLRRSYDTPEYVGRVREETGFWRLFQGRTLDQLRTLDFAAEGIEGVSGATQTSYAVAAGLKLRAQRNAERHTGTDSASPAWSWRDCGLLLVLAGALWLTFGPVRSRRWRKAWQAVLILFFLIGSGDLLSVALCMGWARSGLPWTTAPALCGLALVSLLVPWTSRQQIYCHQICPHGAAQEWVGRNRRWQIHLPPRLGRWLGYVPGLLLCAAGIVAFLGLGWDLSSWEPFDGWILKQQAPISLGLAVASLLVAVVLPQSYCRYGCPTGALLKFVRSHGARESFGGAEWTAGLLVLSGAAWLSWPAVELKLQRVAAPEAVQASEQRLEGQAFGTFWSVTVRGAVADPAALQQQLATELERVESRLSHWRPESETSQFNASDTTLEMEYSPELIDLLALTQQVSQQTRGAYDVTLAPLTDAWGYGPSGPHAAPPTDAEIATLRARVGWQKLHIDREYHSLRKEVPDLQLDLGSVLQGYAADRLAEQLRASGVQEFLIDVGGELRCAGTWRVAVDGVAGRAPLRTLDLQDAALATSGTYRPGPNGAPETAHILSPQTGRPVASPHVLCAVIAPTAQAADMWATALFCVPSADAQRLASQAGLSLLLVDGSGKTIATGQFATADNPQPKPWN